MNYVHLPGLVLGDTWHKDRIIASVPARGGVDADVAAIGSFVEPFTTGKSTVAPTINGIKIIIIFFVSVDKQVGVGRKRNIPFWIGEHPGCA